MFLRMVSGFAVPLLAAAAASAVAGEPINAGSGLMLQHQALNLSLPSANLRASGSEHSRAEVWMAERWGLSGSLYRVEPDEAAAADGSDHVSIDLKRRVFSTTDNKFLAVGLGWENIDFESGDSSAGMRLIVEGRFRLLGSMYLYGQSAWLPSLEDVAGRSELQGSEVQAGLAFKPADVFSLQAGYRHFRLDYIDEDTGAEDFAESGGFVLGGGFHW